MQAGFRLKPGILHPLTGHGPLPRHGRAFVVAGSDRPLRSCRLPLKPHPLARLEGEAISVRQVVRDLDPRSSA